MRVSAAGCSHVIAGAWRCHLWDSWKVFFLGFRDLGSLSLVPQLFLLLGWRCLGGNCPIVGTKHPLESVKMVPVLLFFSVKDFMVVNIDFEHTRHHTLAKILLELLGLLNRVCQPLLEVEIGMNVRKPRWNCSTHASLGFNNFLVRAPLSAFICERLSKKASAGRYVVDWHRVDVDVCMGTIAEDGTISADNLGHSLHKNRTLPVASQHLYRTFLEIPNLITNVFIHARH
mmetsp:Transcript_26297/g.58138  ORF Transcript_26297/g.58138 Transcript_26297/m.58138 type:complete len:230 (-) Transcript_26297:1443-2132(-)